MLLAGLREIVSGGSSVRQIPWSNESGGTMISDGCCAAVPLEYVEIVKDDRKAAWPNEQLELSG